jgi:hypothetical protein
MEKPRIIRNGVPMGWTCGVAMVRSRYPEKRELVSTYYPNMVTCPCNKTFEKMIIPYSGISSWI